MSFRALAVLITCALSACAAPSQSNRAYIKTVADQAIGFDRSKVVAVSARNERDLYERNLAFAVRALLQEQGIKVGDAEHYDYVLKVERHSKIESVTDYDKVTLNSHTTLAAAGQTGYANTSTTAKVPAQKDRAFRVIVLRLWDARDIMSDVPMIWMGALTGRADVVDAHEGDALSALVRRIGVSVQQAETVDLVRQ